MNFVLFACCIPVKGARRSIICDLQRQAYRFIPNGLYEILTTLSDKTIVEIKDLYLRRCDKEIDEYFQFLENNEFGFWSNEPGLFPRLDMTFRTPERVTNALIDVGAESRYDFGKIFQELDDLGCKAVEVRFFRRTSGEELRRILEITKFGRLRSVEILIRYSEDLDRPVLECLCVEYPRISRISVYSAPEHEIREVGQTGAFIYFVSEEINSPSCCGQVSPTYFVLNLPFFSEAKNFNSCLNGKISIDARGEIKNCPSLPFSYGNISDTSLHSALTRQGFPALWAINKDQVDVCKDCEFRYICPDCRAYIENPDDIYSKPSKCSYDPYTAQWR